MKKIIFYFPLFQIGGTEKNILNLIRKLNGFEIYVAHANDNSNIDILNELSKYATVINIKKHDLDIEFDYFISCSMRFHTHEFTSKIKRKHNILWVNYLMDIQTTILYSEEIKTVDLIITVSNTISKQLKQQFPNLESKIIPIYNIVDIQEIIDKSKEDCQLNLSNELNLVTVCRITEEKGFHRMKQLAAYLKEAGINFKWFVVGGSYYKEIEEKIIADFDKLSDHFEWLGFLDNPHKIVKQCDYSVCLSDEETWGFVITEALALGVPCIVSDFPVAFEQVIDKETGIILSRNNLSSYKDRIDDIINNKQKYKQTVLKYTYKNEDKIIKDWNMVLK